MLTFKKNPNMQVAAKQVFFGKSSMAYQWKRRGCKAGPAIPHK